MRHKMAVRKIFSAITTTGLLFGSLAFGTVPSAQAATTNLSGIIQVSVGSSYSLALKSDGTVLAWGNGGSSRLGNGASDQSTLPAQVTGLGPGSGVIAVSAGGATGYALKSDGTVWAWGGNGFGSVGDGTTTQRDTPVQVSGATGVIAISGGFTHAIALKSDGTVLCWGRNASGACGDGTTNSPIMTPQLVTGSATGVIAIAAGANSNLAIKSDGTVIAWGNNTNGSLGDGTTTNRLTPVQVSGLGSGSGVVAITKHSGLTNSNSSGALKSDGTVLAWGANGAGQLGDGTTTTRLTPVQVSGLGSGSGVTAISMSGGSSYALKSDGTVLAWGSNVSGKLGDGTTTTRLTPIQVSGLGSGSGVTAIAAGDTSVLALKSDTTVLAWGNNSTGQLGDGTFQGQITPVQTSGLGSGSGVTAISTGLSFSLASKSDGTVFAWGSNAFNQLGDGTTTDRITPVQVTSATGVIAVAAGDFHALALKSDGTVLSWGRNNNGQLGDGTTTQRSTPVQVTSATGVIAIGASENSSFALRSNGTVLAWGSNGNGQLGDGTTSQRNAPVQVTGSATGVIAIASGQASYALKSDGTVLAWGYNGFYDVGDGTTTNRSTPVQVSGLGSGSGVIAIGAHLSGGYALKSDGTVMAWGANSDGQLGDGTKNSAPTPVQTSLGAGSGVTAVRGDDTRAFALKSDGTVLAWGANIGGGLGDGTTTQRLTPVQVSGLGSGSGVTAVSAPRGFGALHALALKTDGTVLAWGADDSGQLGDGTVYTKNLTPSNVLFDIPAITAAQMQDSDADGIVDRIALTFDEALADTPAGANGFDVTSVSDHGSCTGETADPSAANTLNLDFTCTTVGTTVGDLTLAFTANSGIVNAAGHQALSVTLNSASSPALTDGAKPVLVSSTPADGATQVSRTNDLTLLFSEPMDHASTESAFSLTPSAGTNAFSWSATDTVLTVNPANLLAGSSHYTIDVTGTAQSSASGDPAMAATSVSFRTVSSGGSVSMPPSVSLVQPNGGEHMTSGSSYQIIWSESGDGIATERLSLSTNGGNSYSSLATGLTSGSYLWNIPSSLQTSQGRIRVEGVNDSGTVIASAASLSDFTVTGTTAPPSSGDGGSATLSPTTGGEGAGAFTGIEGADTSSSGQGAMTREQANSHLPPSYPVDALVKLADDGDPATEVDSTVYYLGLDAKRHPFINAAAYASWYSDFSQVEIIDASTLASIPLGAPILVRPGTYWVKIQSDPRTYYVEPGYKLRWIKDEATASKLGGPDWNKNIVDVDTSFFVLYSAGADIDTAYLLTSWPSGTLIDSSLNLQDDRHLLGLRWYVTGGKKRAFVPDTAFGANNFQSRFAWNHAADLGSVQTLNSLASGPDIVGQEDALFSLMH